MLAAAAKAHVCALKEKEGKQSLLKMAAVIPMSLKLYYPMFHPKSLNEGLAPSEVKEQ